MTTIPTIDLAAYGPDKLDRELAGLCQAHPETRNPTASGGGCVYFTGVDTGVGCRCLIGELLHRHGWEVDPELWENAYYVLEELGYRRDTAERAKHWQSYADGDGQHPVRWGVLPELVAHGV